MGNRSSSSGSKHSAYGIVGRKKVKSNGTQSAALYNTSNAPTKPDELVDRRPSLNLRTYRSFSQRDQVSTALIIITIIVLLISESDQTIQTSAEIETSAAFLCECNGFNRAPVDRCR